MYYPCKVACAVCILLVVQGVDPSFLEPCLQQESISGYASKLEKSTASHIHEIKAKLYVNFSFSLLTAEEKKLKAAQEISENFEVCSA